MDLLQKIKENARKHEMRIVLPEGTEIRTLKAANQIIEEKLAKIILLGSPEVINKTASENNLTNIKNAIIIDPKIMIKKKLIPIY